MTQDHKSTSEEIAQKGREAQSLLEHPMLKEFFEEEERKSFEAFKQLPFNCELDNLRALQAYTEALGKLKSSIKEHIERFQDEQIRREEGFMVEEDG